MPAFVGPATVEYVLLPVGVSIYRCGEVCCYAFCFHRLTNPVPPPLSSLLQGVCGVAQMGVAVLMQCLARDGLYVYLQGVVV